MSRRFVQPGLGLLILSAFASGFAALALELLWGRELALTFGSSQYAVAAVLTAFMVGLGTGAAGQEEHCERDDAPGPACGRGRCGTGGGNDRGACGHGEQLLEYSIEQD